MTKLAWLSSGESRASARFFKASWLSARICAESKSNWICNDKAGSGAASTCQFRRLRLRPSVAVGGALSCSIICSVLGDPVVPSASDSAQVPGTAARYSVASTTFNDQRIRRLEKKVCHPRLKFKSVIFSPIDFTGTAFREFRRFGGVITDFSMQFSNAAMNESEL